MAATSGSADVRPGATPPGGRAAPVLCCLYDEDSGTYTPLENVVCDRIQKVEGPTPPQARFHYLLDAIAQADGYPTRFERLWGADASGKGVVRPDDRIVVLTWSPRGDREVLFDGYAAIPQVDVSDRIQTVTIQAQGVASRCFDRPIGRRRQRGSDDLEAGEPVDVDLPVRFNPGGIPNRSPDGADVGADEPETAYPVFVDELYKPSEGEDDPREYWTLSDAVRYLLRVYNHDGPVKFPRLDRLAEILDSRRPKEGTTYDANDPATYESDPIVVRDFDASNRPWPEALGELLGLHGFGMRWYCEADEDGAPFNGLRIYRLDAGDSAAPKPVDLDEPGRPLDPARNTAESFGLARDLNAVVNAFELDVPPRRVEASFVLAPGFTPASGDGDVGTRKTFLGSAIAAAGVSAETRNKYRLYVADEDGSGHWRPAGGWTTGQPLDLAAIFPPDPPDPGADASDGPPAPLRAYVVRRRPGASRLLSTDGRGEPRKAQLALSRNYSGTAPAVWDGTGDWQPIRGGWRLLEDRLGIYVEADDVEAWAIGAYSGPNPQEPSKTLRGITSQADPAAPNARFVLRLTTVVEADRSPTWSAARRAASPTQFERRRRIDARDHFRLDTVAKSSAFAADEDADEADFDVRDDTGEALALAYQLRSKYETPPLVGSIASPGVSLAWEIGDRIEKIRGRECDLRRNAGAGQGEAPTYPRVTSVVWTFSSGQRTEIGFTDQAGGPRPQDV